MRKPYMVAQSRARGLDEKEIKKAEASAHRAPGAEIGLAQRKRGRARGGGENKDDGEQGERDAAAQLAAGVQLGNKKAIGL